MIEEAVVKEWMKEGRPLEWSEPRSWEEQPKFEAARLIIERWRKDRPGPFTILDVGCFTGYFLREMNHRGPYTGIGIDLHKVLMERLHDKAQEMEW